MLVRIVALIAALAGLAALPAGALAARVIHVSPHGSDPTCSAEQPCSLEEGLTQAVGGDSVLLATGQGSYGTAESPLGELIVPPGASLEGSGGMAEIFSNGAFAAIVLGAGAPGQKLADVEIHSQVGDAVSGSGQIERVIAHGAAGGAGCRLKAQSTIVDSVCSGRLGAYVYVDGTQAEDFSLRNDTLFGTEVGLQAFAKEAQVQIGATNTIARGLAYDIKADTFAPGVGSIGITLDHSNYATVAAPEASVTAPGSGTNQTVAPKLVNPEAGNFAEASGSPTIDAGLNDADNGAADVAGNQRAQASRVFCSETVPGLTDIGAYEFAPPSPPCAPEGRPGKPPRTSLHRVTVRGHFAAVDFRGRGGVEVLRFECKLDAGRYRRCSSPHVYRHLAAGRHRVWVRAVGLTGNHGPSASRRFRILRSAPRPARSHHSR